MLYLLFRQAEQLAEHKHAQVESMTVSIYFCHILYFL